MLAVDLQPSQTLRCPTCRAVQEWSDTCRRCKCDLRLLRAAADSYEVIVSRCLAELHAGRAREALETAHECFQVWPGEKSRRLLAVCALLLGDWPRAVAIARQPSVVDP